MEDKHNDAASATWVSWDDSYELGIPQIDEQHRRLVALCDKFHADILSVRGNASGPGWKVFLSDVLRDTAQYASTHFAEEEKIMELAQYSGLDFHRECHQEFINSVSDILNSFQRVTLQTAMEFSSYLKNWVLFHIAYEDKHFEKCVKEYFKKMKDTASG